MCFYYIQPHSSSPKFSRLFTSFQLNSVFLFYSYIPLHSISVAYTYKGMVISTGVPTSYKAPTLRKLLLPYQAALICPSIVLSKGWSLVSNPSPILRWSLAWSWLCLVQESQLFWVPDLSGSVMFTGSCFAAVILSFNSFNLTTSSSVIFTKPQERVRYRYAICS